MPRSATRSDAESDAARLQSAGRLQVAMLKASRALKARFAEQGDALADFFLLHLIDQAGTLRSTALAAAAGLDHSTVSRRVARLVDSGWVWRESDPGDRRAGLLSLTPRGRVALDRSSERRAGALAEATSGWPGGDVARLADLLSRLGDDLASGRCPLDPVASDGAPPIHDKESP